MLLCQWVILIIMIIIIIIVLKYTWFRFYQWDASLWDIKMIQSWIIQGNKWKIWRDHHFCFCELPQSQPGSLPWLSNLKASWIWLRLQFSCGAVLQYRIAFFFWMLGLELMYLAFLHASVHYLQNFFLPY